MSGDVAAVPLSTDVRPADAPISILVNDGSDWPAAIVGGKGSSLLRMTALRLPVPPFFVLTTKAWTEWRSSGGLSDDLRRALRAGVQSLETATGRSFGSGPDPLLVSVRSSGTTSMPGMMDTVLNVGISPETIQALYAQSGRLSWIHDLVGTLIHSFPGDEVPADCEEQLCRAIVTIFASWDNDRAKLYRRLNRLDDDAGTAVVIQLMAFGNRDEESCSGVLFSRDAVTGAATPAGNWLPLAQGEVTVQGLENGHPLADLEKWNPAAYDQLMAAAQAIEAADSSAQDIEFTIERGELYLLQCRPLRVRPLAACRIHLDMFDEGLLSEAELVARLGGLTLDDMYVEELTVAEPAVASGSAASPGVGSGVCVRDRAEAAKRAQSGSDVVLVRQDTSPNDFAAMKVSRAIVTERGGETSHAAIVARELGIPCVVGCGDLDALAEGALLTVDGSTGEVFDGRHTATRTVPPIVERAREILRGHERGEPT